MNQYIITEDIVCEGCNCCKRDGVYEKECCILLNIRSHPYNPQAEREKVLDEVLKKTETLHETFVCPHLNHPCPEGKICEVCYIEYVIEELREGKDGE
jgi:hypothetical protein